MLETFTCRNFYDGNTLSWLCRLTFDSHLDLPHRPAWPTFRAAVQAVTGANNRTAFDILKSGLDYVERTSKPATDDDFLQVLKEIYHDHDSRTRSDIESLRAMAEQPASRCRIATLVCAS